MKKMIVEIKPNHNVADIDWNKMKKCGADGVFKAAGEADYHGKVKINEYAVPCIEASAECGIEVGIEINIKCRDPFAAHEAAAAAAEFARENCATLGVAYTFGEQSNSCLIGQGKEGLTNTAVALLFETERLGCSGIIRTDFDFADTYLDIERISGKRLWGDFKDDGNAKGWNQRLLMHGIASGDEHFIAEIAEFDQHLKG